MRQRARAGREERGRVRGHAAAALDLLAVQGARPLGGRVGAHLVERPEEVDRGRPRRREHALGLVEVLAAQRGEREAVRGGDPIAGAPRTARVRIASATSAAVSQTRSTSSSGKPALVEQDDTRPVLLEANDSVRLELVSHGRMHAA